MYNVRCRDPYGRRRRPTDELNKTDGRFFARARVYQKPSPEQLQNVSVRIRCFYRGSCEDFGSQRAFSTTILERFSKNMIFCSGNGEDFGSLRGSPPAVSSLFLPTRISTKSLDCVKSKSMCVHEDSPLLNCFWFCLFFCFFCFFLKVARQTKMLTRTWTTTTASLSCTTGPSTMRRSFGGSSRRRVLSFVRRQTRRY